MKTRFTFLTGLLVLWLAFCVSPAMAQTTTTTGTFFRFNTAPILASGFGTSPVLSPTNGTSAFSVVVGAGGTAATGVLTLPAATTGWACVVNDVTSVSASVSQTKVTASSTTSITVGNFTDLAISGPWNASDVLLFQCSAY